MGRERDERFPEEATRKQRRKQRARKRPDDSIWFGLGMFGLIGWSVAIPIVLGVAVGLWIDSRTGSGISWTLMLLGAGVIAGSVHAWFWITKERNEMKRYREWNDDD